MDIRLLKNDEPLPMDLLLQANPSGEIIKEYIQRGKCYILEEHDNIIGVFVLIPTRPGTVELVNVSVAEEKQGRELGKRLVEEAIKIATLARFKKIEVGTGNSSISQIALYQKFGFRMTHIDKDFFIHHYKSPIFENGIQCVDMVRFSLDLI
ncbi:GNAT family N-acetyltransferase [Lysinibacillus sp. KU-BSD001]|uniref:GNAT family N-acetyltransferase n=1 Tax=Lysinibacillus sp. KU-BSD001 TaxID=3141328 RepID=UPI0036EDE473